VSIEASQNKFSVNAEAAAASGRLWRFGLWLSAQEGL